MHINLNVDMNKIQQKKQQRIKTGMSMQNTVNGALNLPQNNGNGQIPQPTKQDGWGANVQ